jgi:hypothetical protein
LVNESSSSDHQHSEHSGTNTEHWCNAPHVSSGQERSPVAEVIVTFKLLRRLVP